MTRMSLYKLAKFLWRTTFCKAASSIQIRNKDLFVWTKYLVCLTHKVNATHHNNVCISLCSLLSKCKTVANEVCYVLYLTLSVIMRHDDCILFLAHPSNLSLHICTFRYRFCHKSGSLPIVVNHLLYYYKCIIF